MPTRAEKSAARRRAHHAEKLDAAPDSRHELWAAWDELRAAAHRSGRLPDVIHAVRRITMAVRKGDPI
jgi:hypothetical protein